MTVVLCIQCNHFWGNSGARGQACTAVPSAPRLQTARAACQGQLWVKSLRQPPYPAPLGRCK